MSKGEWKEYFIFSKKERIAVFILLGIIAIFIFITFWYQPVFTKPAIDTKVQQQLTAIASRHSKSNIDSTDEDAADSTKETYTAKSGETTHELFYFDPNTLDSLGWRRLGFGDKAVEHILDYRRTKGRFNKPEDLYNVFRIRKKNVAAVLPYVRMGSGLSQSSAQTAAKPIAIAPATVAASYKIININTAVAEDFKEFPGVTDAVAARIIKFRTSLNGFKSVDDVAKTYGLPGDSFKIMKPYLRM